MGGERAQRLRRAGSHRERANFITYSPLAATAAEANGTAHCQKCSVSVVGIKIKNELKIQRGFASFIRISKVMHWAPKRDACMGFAFVSKVQEFTCALTYPLLASQLASRDLTSCRQSSR